MIERQARNQDYASVIRQAEVIFADTKEMLRPVDVVLDMQMADEVRKVVIDGYAQKAGLNRKGKPTNAAMDEEETLSELARSISIAWNAQPKNNQGWMEIPITGKQLDAYNRLIFEKIVDYTESITKAPKEVQKSLLREQDKWDLLFDEVNAAFVYDGGQAREVYKEYLLKKNEE